MLCKQLNGRQKDVALSPMRHRVIYQNSPVYCSKCQGHKSLYLYWHEINMQTRRHLCWLIFCLLHTPCYMTWDFCTTANSTRYGVKSTYFNTFKWHVLTSMHFNIIFSTVDVKNILNNFSDSCFMNVVNYLKVLRRGFEIGTNSILVFKTCNTCISIFSIKKKQIFCLNSVL